MTTRTRITVGSVVRVKADVIVQSSLPDDCHPIWKGMLANVVKLEPEAGIVQGSSPSVGAHFRLYDNQVELVNMLEPYQFAVAAQESESIAILSRQFASCQELVWHEVRTNGGGPREFNWHPVTRLFVAKMYALTGIGAMPTQHYNAALSVCKSKILPELAKAAAVP